MRADESDPSWSANSIDIKGEIIMCKKRRLSQVVNLEQVMKDSCECVERLCERFIEPLKRLHDRIIESF